MTTPNLDARATPGPGQTRAGATVPEWLRSLAWHEAKAAAFEEWNRGSADTTQMLRCASSAVDAALSTVMALPVEQRMRAMGMERVTRVHVGDVWKDADV